ncbi:MAG: hypothetical protein ABI809_04120 [Caldimonas sp.]
MLYHSASREIAAQIASHGFGEGDHLIRLSDRPPQTRNPGEAVIFIGAPFAFSLAEFEVAPDATIGQREWLIPAFHLNGFPHALWPDSPSPEALQHAA